MADPITHALVGAAISPNQPIYGAVAGLAPDVMIIPMNVYTLIKHRRFATGSNWHLAPEWMRSNYAWCHSMGCVLLGLFIVTFGDMYDYMPALAAYASHVVIDAYLHSTTSIAYPFVRRSVAIGINWWSKWWIPALSIWWSFWFACLRLGWL
jgi:hypothetical protein